MGKIFRSGSLKYVVLLLLVAVLALPGVSFAETKEQKEFIAYVDQIGALSKYSAKAVDAYNNNLHYNAKNRKSMYSLYVKTIIPEFTKYVKELKKIKPKNKEIARLHKIMIQAMETKLKGFNEVKTALSKSPANLKMFDNGQEMVVKGGELQDQFTEALVTYYKGLEPKS